MKTMIRALCIALLGLAALPKVRAQQFSPEQRVPDSPTLSGTEWILIESHGQHVAQNGWQPHLKLKMLERYQRGSSGQVEGMADSCGDRLSGTYRVTANRLRFEIDNVAASLRTCLVSKDMAPVNIGPLLEGSPQFRLHGAKLDLLDNSGEVRARFIAASAR
jgi:hypothetical protein